MTYSQEELAALVCDVVMCCRFSFVHLLILSLILLNICGVHGIMQVSSQPPEGTNVF